ncbi:MAG: magnesium-translocating P-type ATPase, partial [Methanomicrobiales archaeon]|nr:magnesium-translocating P-type ATPase [Methanomicrobiales archaeon]
MQPRRSLPGREALTSEGAISMVKAATAGLSAAEVEERRALHGLNELAEKRKRSVAIDFLLHFRNPLVLILLIAGGISVLVGETVNAAIIFTIITASVFIDFFQEHRAERAVSLLRKRIMTTATVMRDGRKQEIGLVDLVPGDIILLAAGDLVPADAIVLSAKDFFVNQSALTGEPFPVERWPVTSPDGKGEEVRNRLFLGTSVVSGTATAVIIKTGSATEYGKIARKLSARPPETEMERGLKKFGYLIMQIVFFLVIFVFLINALYRHSVLDSLLFAVALAVGVTPELLPMILSLNLSRGAIAMSGKGVIVKHLASIQNLGSMDILCTDKTGTLTENRITLIRHVDAQGRESEKVLLFSFLNSSYQTGLKSPLDDAILKFREIDIGRFRKVDEIPFDFIRKRISIIVEEDARQILIAKGAPEEILRVCNFQENGDTIEELDDEAAEQILSLYQGLSGEGFRTLGVAYRPFTDQRSVYSTADECGMIFLGFVAFIDPPKESARESLELLNRTGIQLKILTGDNELVTRKTCDLLGYPYGRIIPGSEIATMDDDALARVVEGADLFTRTTPDQKDRIILALKRNGHVVGYLGDGINDAPSLRTADIGISVDNAVDIARESSDIILLKKDLRVIEEGVREGRRTFGNTMKYIMMGTSSNFGNMFSVAAASLFLPFLPMLPIQILLNNLLYDLSQSAIPTDTVDPEYTSAPKRLDIGFIKKFIAVFGPISSLFDILTFVILLVVFSATEPLFQTAWFIESLATQVAIIFVIRTRRTPFLLSRPSLLLALSCTLVIAAAFLLPFTPLGLAFGFVRLPGSFYL